VRRGLGGSGGAGSSPDGAGAAPPAAAAAPPGSVFRALRHEFLVVRGEGSYDGAEFIVDPHFSEHFAVSHEPTVLYSACLESLPPEFVGTAARLAPLVSAAAAAMAESFRVRGLPLPPWRRAQALLSKWMPLRSRDVVALVPPALLSLGDVGSSLERRDSSSSSSSSSSSGHDTGHPACGSPAPEWWPLRASPPASPGAGGGDRSEVGAFPAGGLGAAAEQAQAQQARALLAHEMLLARQAEERLQAAAHAASPPAPPRRIEGFAVAAAQEGASTVAAAPMWAAPAPLPLAAAAAAAPAVAPALSVLPPAHEGAPRVWRVKPVGF
jgi:uncharacterized protein (TIGR01615 family)